MFFMSYNVFLLFWQWFTLSDVKHGRVHLILEWLPTVTQPERLQKVQNNNGFICLFYFLFNLLPLFYFNFLFSLGLGYAVAVSAFIPEQICPISSAALHPHGESTRPAGTSHKHSMIFYHKL